MNIRPLTVLFIVVGLAAGAVMADAAISGRSVRQVQSMDAGWVLTDGQKREGFSLTRIIIALSVVMVVRFSGRE